MADPKGFLVVPVAYRADGTIHALELDTSDRLKVLIDSITGSVTVIFPSPSLNNPISAGANVTNLNLPAGFSTQTVYTVPASQGIRVRLISVSYSGTVAGVTLIPRFIIGGTTLNISTVIAPVSGAVYPFYFDVGLNAGDSFVCAVSGATLNDDFAGVICYDRIL